MQVACAGASLRAVAVRDLHAVAGFAQAFGHILGNHHGAVLAAGAAEGNGQIAFAFANVVRQ